MEVPLSIEPDVRLGTPVSLGDPQSGIRFLDYGGEGRFLVTFSSDAEEDERAEDPPAEGESETFAEIGEEAPLTAEEASEILGISHLDATVMLQKLLALEGRSRWGRRPSGLTRRW